VQISAQTELVLHMITAEKL